VIKIFTLVVYIEYSLKYEYSIETCDILNADILFVTQINDQ